MVQQAGDKRVFSRVACQSEATHADSGISLGKMRDVGLHGAFISCAVPLPLHAVFSLRFRVGASDMRADAEVVRVTENGMGLRFISQSRADSKALRRFVIDAVGNLAFRDAVEQVFDAGATITAPIADPEQIAKLLRDSRQTTFLIVSKSSDKRYKGTMYHMTADTVGLLCDSECVLAKDEEIFVLYTRDFESYSFKTTVKNVAEKLCEMHVPAGILYSERRASRRTALPQAVFTCAHGADGGSIEYEVMDTSEFGLSVRVNERSADLWPGVLLPDASMFVDGTKQTLANVVVQNVTRAQDADGTEWFRVGLSHGRMHAAFDEAREVVSAPTGRGGIRNRIAKRVKNAVDGAVYLAHTQLLPRILGTKEEFRVLDFANASGKPLVGLLNTSWKQTDQRVKATVVLIPPGFTARKETMGALAYMLTHLFAQEGKDVAVLRFDGTNNVGESYKEPGYNVEGKETINLTVSDGVDDIVGAYDWAESNPIVDPTEIVIVSASLSSIAVRHALASERLKSVKLWIPLMGAVDAANAGLNVGGHIDGYSNFLKGIKTGTIPMMGYLVDSDNFCRDMHDIRAATLDDAKRDIARIDADIMWIAGTHDAFMDIRRTRQVLAVPSKSKRQLVEVDAGHLPRSSDEALAEFAIISKAILRHANVNDPQMELPSPGWIGAMTEREWRRVRKASGSDDRARWWRSQFESTEKVGEVLEFSPEYKALIDIQKEWVPASARNIVDLGCGWGTLTRRMLENPQVRLTALDIVDVPLKRLRSAIPGDRLTTIKQSVDGNPVIAVRRWVQGELPDLSEAIASLPVERLKQVMWLAGLNDSRVHMAMRGNDVDLKALAQGLAMSPANQQGLKDMHALARFATGRIDAAEFQRIASPQVRAALNGAALLPLASESVDCVTCSLVINFLQRPEDTLSEAYRMLKKSGRLIVSAYVEDADMSEICLALISEFEREGKTWPHPTKDLLEGARRVNTFFSQVRHLEEEGTFGKFTEASLTMMLRQAGFTEVTARNAFGQPARVVVASGVKS